MMLSGKEVRNYKIGKLSTVINETGIIPKLLIVQVEGRADSDQYVGNKKKVSKDIGIEAIHELLSAESKTSNEIMREIFDTINNYKDRVDGIIVQTPIPKLTEEENNFVLNMVPWRLDVDKLGRESLMEFYVDRDNFSAIDKAPCTPAGIMELLKFYGMSNLTGKKVCILGRSNTVGLPLSHLMLNSDATVTICHSKTSEDKLYKSIESSDILIAAVGKPNFINEKEYKDIDWSDKIIIDVGVNKVGNEWLGDVTNVIKEQSKHYTPTPGGAGPMTIITLLERVVNNAINKDL